MPRDPVAQSFTDSEDFAKAAGLIYVTDAQPGIVRKRSGKGFRFIDPQGKPLRDEKTLARIKSLVIPPAWTDVWITTRPNGHLQATGRDAKGRKQSRYHLRWREIRDETKYERMRGFAEALPHLRETVDQDLRRPGLPYKKVLATIVSLMETTLIRVGNEEYARKNKSFGLTTMRTRHVEIEGSQIRFEFVGKSRIHHTVDLKDRRLASIIRRCVDLPGYELFQYVDHEGNRHSVDSSDVNKYLQEITGENYTAKDFRTWAGTVLAHQSLLELPQFNSVTEAKKNVAEAIKHVAARLGNTPSICRKCYVHPAVLEAYIGGMSPQEAREKIDEELADHSFTLHQEEQALVDLLAQRALVAVG